MTGKELLGVTLSWKLPRSKLEDPASLTPHKPCMLCLNRVEGSIAMDRAIRLTNHHGISDHLYDCS
jgi:hypothetical protein